MPEYTVILRDSALNAVAQLYPSESIAGPSKIQWSRSWRDLGQCELVFPSSSPYLGHLLTLGNYIEVLRDGVFEAIYVLHLATANLGILEHQVGSSGHANAVYAAGQGEGIERDLLRRKVQASIDLLGRMEHYQDARDITLGDSPALTARADAVLSELAVTASTVAKVGEPVAQETVTVMGISPAIALKKRLILPPPGTIELGSDKVQIGTAEYYVLSGPADAAMRQLVSDQAIAPADTERAVANLVIGEGTITPTPANTSFQGRFQSVLEGLQEIGAVGPLGFEVVYSTADGNLEFLVSPQRDRSIASTTPVVFDDTDVVLDIPDRSYRTDWDVGDLVTVQLGAPVAQQINMTILEVQVTLEAGHADKLHVAFNTPTGNLFTKLTQAVAKQVAGGTGGLGVVSRVGSGGGSSLIHDQTKHQHTGDENFGGFGATNLGTLKPAVRSPILGVPEETGTLLTIASRAITRTRSIHTLLAEGGAPVGTLERVNGFSSFHRDVLIISPSQDDQSILVKCTVPGGYGNIVTRDGLDRTLFGTGAVMVLLWNPVQGLAVELGPSGIHEEEPDLAARVGKYRGDGLRQFIPCNFTPQVVIAKGDDATANEGVAVIRTDQHLVARGVTTGADCQQALSIAENGFWVDHAEVSLHKTNKAGVDYFYQAYGGPYVSTDVYFGTAVDNRTLTGFGFDPVNLFIQADQVGYERALRWRSTPMGVNDLAYDAAVGRADAIKSLIADGATLGTYDGVNALSSLNFQEGAYMGNGTTQDIPVDFDPKLVIVKLDMETTDTTIANESTGVICTPNTGGGKSIADGSLAANACLALGTAKFTVTYDAAHAFNANVPDERYIWYALGGPTVRTGTYTGNTIGQDVNPAGQPSFPEMMIVVPSSGPLRFRLRTTMGAGTVSSNFGPLADENDAIDNILAAGFHIGTNAAVNTLTVVYPYVTLEPAGNFSHGAYTADGVDNRDLPATALAFDPDVVSVKSSGANAAVFKTLTYAATIGPNTGSQLGIFGPSLRYDAVYTTAEGYHFGALANRIKDLRRTTGKFRVGNTAEVNSAGTYYFFAFKAASPGVRYVRVAMRASPRLAVGSYSGMAAHEQYALTNADTGFAIGNAAATMRQGQGFKVPSNLLLGYVVLRVRKVGSPTDGLQCRIPYDEGGVPNDIDVRGTSGVVPASALTTSFAPVRFEFDRPILIPNTQYYYDLMRTVPTPDAANYYEVEGDASAAGYANGSHHVYSSATGWGGATANDLVFELYPDNRNLPSTALTFDPDILHIKGDLAQEAVFKTLAMEVGDTPPLTGSLHYHAGSKLDNRVQALNVLPGQFELGTDDEVNQGNPGTSYYYFAVEGVVHASHQISDIAGLQDALVIEPHDNSGHLNKYFHNQYVRGAAYLAGDQAVDVGSAVTVTTGTVSAVTGQQFEMSATAMLSYANSAGTPLTADAVLDVWIDVGGTQRSAKYPVLIQATQTKKLPFTLGLPLRTADIVFWSAIKTTDQVVNLKCQRRTNGVDADTVDVIVSDVSLTVVALFGDL